MMHSAGLLTLVICALLSEVVRGSVASGEPILLGQSGAAVLPTLDELANQIPQAMRDKLTSAVAGGDDPADLVRRVAARLDNPESSPEDRIRRAEQHALRHAQLEAGQRERVEEATKMQEAEHEADVVREQTVGLHNAERRFHAHSYDDAVKQAETQALFNAQEAAISQESQSTSAGHGQA